MKKFYAYQFGSLLYYFLVFFFLFFTKINATCVVLQNSFKGRRTTFWEYWHFRTVWFKAYQQLLHPSLPPSSFSSPSLRNIYLVALSFHNGLIFTITPKSWEGTGDDESFLLGRTGWTELSPAWPTKDSQHRGDIPGPYYNAKRPAS